MADLETYSFTVGGFRTIRSFHHALTTFGDMMKGRVQITHDRGVFRRTYVAKATAHELNVLRLGLSMRRVYEDAVI